MEYMVIFFFFFFKDIGSDIQPGLMLHRKVSHHSTIRDKHHIDNFHQYFLALVLIPRPRHRRAHPLSLQKDREPSLLHDTADAALRAVASL